MKKFIFALALFAACVVRADITPPPAATQAEVNAGLIGNKYVSPKTLANSTSSGGVTNYAQDATVTAWVTTNNFAKSESDDIVGCVQEITARGYRANLVDVWPLQSRWGTNQLSLYGVPWTGWNQNVSGQYANPDAFYNTGFSYPYSATNPAPNVTILPLRTNVLAYTLAVVVEKPIARDANAARNYTGFTASIGGSDSSVALVNQAGYEAGLGVTTANGAVDFGYPQNGSNVIYTVLNGGMNTLYQEFFYRTTWIISYDGAGHYSAWKNANPCGFSTNNNSAHCLYNYNCPITVTNVMNHIVLGFDNNWGTNGYNATWPSSGHNANAQPYAGIIHSVMLFNIAAETNIVLTNTMLGSPLANCAYAASRWLEKSDIDVAVEGTSMMRPNYRVGGIQTNEIGLAIKIRHPEYICFSDLSCAGQSLTSMRAATQSAMFPAPYWNFPYLHITQLPRGKVKRMILITDHPRNDNSLAPNLAVGLFYTNYAPIRPYLTDLIEISDGNMQTTDGNYWKNLTNCYAMQFSPVLTKWVPEFKYVQPKGIFDIGDTNLSSTGNHNDGANQAYAWNACQQWAALIDGVPMQPWGVQTAAGVTNTTQTIGAVWPTYAVTLSGSPCFWTNLVATEAQVMFAGGIVTGISINGNNVPTLPLAGGSTILSPFDVIGFTNTASPPNFQYKPLAPK